MSWQMMSPELLDMIIVYDRVNSAFDTVPDSYDRVVSLDKGVLEMAHRCGLTYGHWITANDYPESWAIIFSSRSVRI